MASLIANALRKKGAGPFSPADFFPSLRGLEPELEPMTEDETRDYLRAVFGALGGRPVPVEA